jgi:hypothetical protein
LSLDRSAGDNRIIGIHAELYDNLSLQIKPVHDERLQGELSATQMPRAPIK